MLHIPYFLSQYFTISNLVSQRNRGSLKNTRTQKETKILHQNQNTGPEIRSISKNVDEGLHIIAIVQFYSKF